MRPLDWLHKCYVRWDCVHALEHVHNARRADERSRLLCFLPSWHGGACENVMVFILQKSTIEVQQGIIRLGLSLKHMRSSRKRVLHFSSDFIEYTVPTVYNDHPMMNVGQFNPTADKAGCCSWVVEFLQSERHDVFTCNAASFGRNTQLFAFLLRHVRAPDYVHNLVGHCIHVPRGLITLSQSSTFKFQTVCLLRHFPPFYLNTSHNYFPYLALFLVFTYS